MLCNLKGMAFFLQILMIINATDSINSHRYKKNQASIAIVAKKTIEFNAFFLYTRKTYRFHNSCVAINSDKYMPNKKNDQHI